MSKTFVGTAALAEAVVSIGLTTLATPATAYQEPLAFRKVASTRQRSSQWLEPSANRSSTIHDAFANTTATSLGRTTTSLEVLIGELRAAALLTADWDGEGAVAPHPASIGLAVAFARLIGGEDLLPEPMIHPSGRVGLLWRTGGLYADLEFYPDGRIAFYAERNEERYRGIAKFDRKSMPALFPPLFRA